jgi:DNA polymerase-3 subunit epsilon
MIFRFRRLRPVRPVCALDVETTGLDPAVDRIVEVGVVRVEPNGRARILTKVVNPGRPIPAAATAVHGLTDATVAGCPAFSAIAPGLLSFLDAADLIGFNLSFDLLFLIAEFRRAGLELDLAGRAVLDALNLFRQKEPRDLSGAVRFYLHRDHRRGHRADADAAAALAVLDAQLARYSELPARPEDLHRRLVPVDVGGRFARGPGGTPVFAFGKHKGTALSDVAAAEPGYLRWLLSAVLLMSDAAGLVRQALDERLKSDNGGR